jgi:hypothetical protein
MCSSLKRIRIRYRTALVDMIRRVGNNAVMFEMLHLFRSTFMRNRSGVTRNDGCRKPGVPHEDGAFNACLKKRQTKACEYILFVGMQLDVFYGVARCSYMSVWNRDMPWVCTNKYQGLFPGYQAERSIQDIMI